MTENPYHVIVVEDAPDTLTLIQRVLALKDLNVHYAVSAQAAIALFDKYGKETTLLVLDNKVPETDGGNAIPNAERLEAAYMALNREGIVLHTSAERMIGVAHQYNKPFNDIFEFADLVARLADENNS